MLLERVRDGNRHEKGHGGRDQGAELHGRMRGVCGVQRPRELGPRPPHEPEYKKRAADARPAHVVMNQRHDLGDAEDEDEIEEELDEGRALVTR
jgi:hypothetical protein